ncbi:hypothetical protein BV20DRAFT_1052888 [Pilatotrama ljubarskyi]|nr:hypothetical protein BV20DRAFT_1052888 [Pilatotrama ljubarskyi]
MQLHEHDADAAGLARGLFSIRLPELKTLVIKWARWPVIPRDISGEDLTIFHAVTALELSGCTFHVFEDLLEAVWACSNLTRLTLSNNLLRKPVPCAKLEYLQLFEGPFSEDVPLPGALFGSHATHLDVDVAVAFSPSLPPILGNLPSLSSLTVSNVLTDASPPPGLAAQAAGTSTAPSAALVPTLIRGLRTPAALKTLKLAIYVSSSSSPDERMLDILFGKEPTSEKEHVAEGEASLRNIVPQLTSLEVRLSGVTLREETALRRRLERAC